MQKTNYKGVEMARVKDTIACFDSEGLFAIIKRAKKPKSLFGHTYRIHQFGKLYEIDRRLLTFGMPVTPIEGRPNRCMTSELVQVGGDYNSAGAAIDAFGEIVGVTRVEG